MDSILRMLHYYLSVCVITFFAIVPLLVGYLVARYCWELIPVGGTNKKAILITGCDSGFGRALSLKCARAGFTVFAGCLTEQGSDSLTKEADALSLHPISLDVANDESVAIARKMVEDILGDKSLWAVVNNAGILSSYGPAEWCSADEYKLSFEVNVLGAVRVTNAFLEPLKRSRGRIITMSSVTGLVPIVGAAPYCVAKFGIEAWNDCIRRELGQFGVSVHLLEAGYFLTTNLLGKKAHENRMASVWDKMPAQLRKDYGEEYRKYVTYKWNAALIGMGSLTIDHVVNDYFHAITARFPRLRYQCGWDAKLFWTPLSFMPTSIQDFILSQFYRGDRPLPAVLKSGVYEQKKRD